MEMSLTTLRLSSSTLPLFHYTDLTDTNSIGYMIMLYPSCIIISHIGPSIWLPACEVSERHAAISRLNFLIALPGNLGRVDLLSIYGHQRKTGKYEQVIH